MTLNMRIREARLTGYYALEGLGLITHWGPSDMPDVFRDFSQPLRSNFEMIIVP
jgi:hypothetical protein